MTTSVGDRIEVEPKKVGQPARSGIVEEVLGQSPSRLRVRWDDGRTSILTPSSGAARITGNTKAKTKKKNRRR
jgi:hypothetical protein